MKHLLIPVWLAAFALSAAAQEETRKDYSLPLDKDGSISISDVSGKISVGSTRGDEVKVSVFRSGKDADKLKVEIISSRKRIEIETRYPKEMDRDFDARIRYEVSLPRGRKSLVLREASGDIKVSGVTVDRCKVTSASGDVTLKDVQADIQARTASGDVAVEGVSGRTLSIHVASGDVTGSSEHESLRLTVASGKVELDLTPPRDTSWDCTVSVVSGDSKLTLPKTVSTLVDLTTLSGRIACDFTLEDRRESGFTVGEHVKGRIGSGDGSVKISSVSGGITLRARNGDHR